MRADSMPGLRTRLRRNAIPCAVAAVPGRERSNPMSLRSLLTAGLVAVGVGMAGPPGSAAEDIGSAVEGGRAGESAVEGKSVSGRVDSRGLRCNKKKTKKP